MGKRNHAKESPASLTRSDKVAKVLQNKHIGVQHQHHGRREVSIKTTQGGAVISEAPVAFPI
jgi:hypothetical protein